MANSDKKIDFEASLKELESIVTKLEDENISLCLLYTSDAADDL